MASKMMDVLWSDLHLRHESRSSKIFPQQPGSYQLAGTFGVLYCFFVIGHDRRRILHFNVTRNPNALWVVQQLREAWAYKQPHRFLLFDRDAKFGAEVLSAVRGMGSEPTRTAFRSPWQFLNERHLKRLIVLCEHFRGSTNQHAIPNRRTSAKEKEILLMRCTTIWRTTAFR